MKVVVNDANILIDLIKLDLLNQFFALECSFYTTDLILEELYDEQKKQLDIFIESERMKVLGFEAEDISRIVEIQEEKPQLSEQDCSAFICAIKVEGELLTSDNTLRRFAVSQNMIVRGHLWMFDQMVEQGIISGTLATDKLKMLIEVVNPRLGLPQKECETRLQAWGLAK